MAGAPKPRPSVVRLQETAELFALPEQETISFGRMHGRSGATANDIVLELPDPSKTAQISRWHFELRRRDERWFVRSLTGNFTDVDGRALANGDEAPIQVGSLVRVGEVATLEFIQPAREAGTSSEADETVVSRPTRAPR